MFCKKCGNKIIENAKFCSKCGEVAEVHKSKEKEDYHYPKPPKKPLWRRAIKFLAILGVIGLIFIIRLGLGYVNSPDYETVTTNDTALESFEAGNPDDALSGFEEALSTATELENKLQITKNIGYVLSSEGRTDEALVKFKEALSFVGSNSFEKKLVSAEIALLEGNYLLAEKEYLSAHNLKPNDFQVNNALNLFYLDLEALAPEFENYPKALTYALTADRTAHPEVRNSSSQNLALAYYFNDNYQKSIELFSKQDLSDPYMSYWLGLSYAASGNDILGLKYLKNADALGVELPQEIIDYINS